MATSAQSLQAVRKSTAEIAKKSPSIFFAKAIFNLGEGQTEGLTYKGLHERFLMSLGANPLSHPTLQPDDTTTMTNNVSNNNDSSDSSSTSSSSSDSSNEDAAAAKTTTCQDSTPEELQEEIEFVKKMMNGESPKFLLDSTMIVTVRSSSEEENCRGGKVTLISPVPCTEDCLREIDALGEVTEIVAPNLQHWIFVEEFAALYPSAKILVAPAALGEDLLEKLPKKLLPRCQVLSEDDPSQFDGSLEARLLRGAPLNLNEFLFFHKEANGGADNDQKGTLIATDGFYGGIRDKSLPTSTFQRLWFKLTKKSFRSARLPIYRTSRVSSHGDPQELLSCVDKLTDQWNFDTILFSHGQNPYNFENAADHHRPGDNPESFPRKAFGRAWHDALDDENSSAALKAAGGMHMIRNAATNTTTSKIS